MTKDTRADLLSQVIEVVQNLEEYRLWVERKRKKSHPIPIPASTVERVLNRAKVLYREMSEYFVGSKPMPKEKPLERDLRKATQKISVAVRENWRLEERIAKLRSRLESKRKALQRAAEKKKADDGPSLFHCA